MIITLTDSAKKHFEQLMEDYSHEAFKFGVTSGGCSGFNYILMETKLDQKNDDDELVEFDDVKIIVDGSSLFAVFGTEIDYTTNMMGSRFEFRNPCSGSSCGCGESFNIKNNI